MRPRLLAAGVAAAIVLGSWAVYAVATFREVPQKFNWTFTADNPDQDIDGDLLVGQTLTVTGATSVAGLTVTSLVNTGTSDLQGDVQDSGGTLTFADNVSISGATIAIGAVDVQTGLANSTAALCGGATAGAVCVADAFTTTGLSTLATGTTTGTHTFSAGLNDGAGLGTADQVLKSGAGNVAWDTLTLASADFVNQGTTTTVLHGNAAGNPSWAAVAAADLSAGTCAARSAVTALAGSLTCTEFVDIASTQASIAGAKTFTSIFGASGSTNFGGVLTTTQTSTSTANTATDDVITAFRTIRFDAGATGGGVGMGVSHDLELENATNGVGEIAGRISSVWTTVGAGTEDADLRLSTMQEGTISLLAQLDGDEDELEVSGGIESTGALGVGVDATRDSTPNADGIQIGTDGSNYSMELTDGSGTPYIDFQNDTAGTDFDARVILQANNVLEVSGANLQLAGGGGIHFDGSGALGVSPGANYVLLYVREDISCGGAAATDCCLRARTSAGAEVTVAVVVTDAGCP